MSQEFEKRAQNRLIALIGRPNVGKSSIFNRLAGKRIAIVHSEPGVTRDRIFASCIYDGKYFEIVDTGGLIPQLPKNVNTIERKTLQQTLEAIKEASVIILVTDVQSRLHELDKQIASFLRSYAPDKPIMVAVNKSDNSTMDVYSNEFLRLGFPVYPVSAVHNRGFDKLMKDIITLLPEEDVKINNKSEWTRISIVGRPNVGKSSLINSLLGKERMIVSDIPGTTRDRIDVEFSLRQNDYMYNFILTDTGGLKRRHKYRSAIDAFSIDSTIESIEKSEIVLLVLDATQGVTMFDKKIAGTILKKQKALGIIVNKWDLVKHISQKEFIEYIKTGMPFVEFSPVICTSALKREGIEDITMMLILLSKKIKEKLPTGILNRVIHRAYDAFNPPPVGGKRAKIFYAVQTGVSPTRIRLFVNKAGLMPKSYQTYIINEIRKAFKLYGVIIVLEEAARR